MNCTLVDSPATRFCFLLLVVCGILLPARPSIAADRVRFAYPAKSLNYLPMTLGRDKGLFQAEGIDLQMILVASTIQVTALTTGDIDFSGAQSQVMAGAARGLPVKVVGFQTIKPSFWLISKPEVKSMAELKSKIIGITAIGSSTDTLARFLLTKHGLTPDRDVALLGTGTTANILTAMKAGTIDAGVLSPPFNAMAKQLGYRTLAYFGDYVEQSLSGLGTSDKLIRDRPDLVRRMLTAMIRSLRFIQQRPAEVAQFIAKQWSVDGAVADELYKSMAPAFSRDGGMDEKGIRDALKRETERMALKEETPLSRVLDLRLLREVQKGL
ncbi:MAG TPA: ABC transporter substrate-binding protein [Candidatus Binatia bacterium]|nr:ABC transporter substrate-binding protein [Candidatus Binatia bacterium]